MINDSSPFWDLVEREHKRARTYCVRLTLNSDEGDDLYQDAVVKAFHGFTQLKNVDAFTPWFYQIINNSYRGRSRNFWWKRVIFTPIEGKLIEPGSDPSDLYEARRRLEYALSALSSDDRIIVTLAELDGWKISEIAQLVGKTEGFVKMRLLRAREKMRRRLSGLYRKATAEEQDERRENLCNVIKPESD